MCHMWGSVFNKNLKPCHLETKCKNIWKKKKRWFSFFKKTHNIQLIWSKAEESSFWPTFDTVICSWISVWILMYIQSPNNLSTKYASSYIMWRAGTIKAWDTYTKNRYSFHQPKERRCSDINTHFIFSESWNLKPLH